MLGGAGRWIDKVLVGVFGAPHGVRGEIRLKSYMQEPLDIADHGRCSDSAGRAYDIAAARPLKDDVLVVRVKGVADRDAAQKLTNEKLFSRAQNLPPPEEDEFYCRDLDRPARRDARRGSCSEPSSPCPITAPATFWRSPRPPAKHCCFPSPAPSSPRSISPAAR